jgi:AcrR family transcriptional regulator
MSSESGPAGRAGLIAAAQAELVEQGLARISLRAIARRAGVSHAAPKYHFGDRSGLLTAVAAAGFRGLAASLSEVADPGSLRDLGRAYVTFALANPQVFELMFRPSELHPDTPELRSAQAEAIGLLSNAFRADPTTSPANPSAPADVPAASLVSWAFAHGLQSLARDGAFASFAGNGNQNELLDRLLDTFESGFNAPPTQTG